MAITIDNKTYRNLEEQVLKNKEDIARHYEVDRVLADWGIKVLGVVDSVDNIPEADYEYGDAFGLSSTDPMQYVIWTEANANVGQPTDYWLNVGALSLVGPQGPQGPQGIQGIQGERGSKWFSGFKAPTYLLQLHKANDMYINAMNGNIYQLNASNVWDLYGNIKGPQGVQGPQGPQGIQGIQGSQGPQGAKGDTGASFQIGGLLESSDLLPAPTEANRYIGYAVKNVDGVTYDLYVVVGTDTLMWVNMGRVEGVEGPQGPVGPQGPAGADIQVVYITGIPETSTQGTLTQDQVNTLLAHPSNYIQFFNENFYPQDVEISEGYIVYSHVGLYEGNTIVKTITLTLATLSWVLTTINVGEAEPPITIVEELPTANEENFVKGKIYTQGELLKYIAKLVVEEPILSQVASLITAASGIAAAVIGTNIYLFGGNSSSGQLNTINKFDTTTNTITTLSTTLPTAANGSGIAVIGTNIYLFGGGSSGGDLNTINKFDTTTNTITTLSTTLPRNARFIAAAAVGTNVYLFGGNSSSGRLSTINKFDTTTNTITTLSTTIPTAATVTAAVIGTNVYLFGGISSSGDLHTINKFDTTTNVITTLSTTLPAAAYGIATAVIGTNIFLFGGYRSSSGGDLKTINKFDTTTNTITTLSTTIPTAVNNIAAAVIGTNIFLFGGNTGSNTYLNTINKAVFGEYYEFKTITAE